MALSGRIAQVQNHRLTDGQLEALAYEFLVPESERPVQCDFSGLEVRKKGGKTVVTFDLVYEEESHHLSAEVSDGSTVSAFTKALDQHFSSLDINITSRFAIKAEFNPEEGRETPDHVPVMVDAKVQVSEGVYTGLVFDTDQDVAGCKAVLFGLNRWLSSRQACKS